MAKEKTTDNINPDHYKVGGIETWDYLKAKMSLEALKGFALGNVMKYVSRADHKNKLEDLLKAQWYLDKIVSELKDGNSKPASTLLSEQATENGESVGKMPVKRPGSKTTKG